MPAQCSDPTWSVTEITDGMKDVTRLYNNSLVLSDFLGKNRPLLTMRSFVVNALSKFGASV